MLFLRAAMEVFGMECSNPGAVMDDLRRRAESRIASGSPAPARTGTEMQALLHELEVHRIELEMQNEQLRLAQMELEASRERYVQLYDGAPVGYVTIDHNGAILACNLTAAEMLGRPREGLLRGTTLQSLMSPQDAEKLHLQLMQHLRGAGKQTCEVDLHRADGRTCRVRLDSVEDAVTTSGLRTNIALIDMAALRGV